MSDWISTPNWERNQTLVDFNYIPNWVHDKILEEWDKPIEGERSRLLNYFISHKLKTLMEDIQEF